MRDRRRRRSLHLRVPGVKPGQKIGPLGPFRGRLGAHWWIGALVVGGLVAAAGAWFLLSAGRPKPPWEPAGPVSRIEPGSAIEVRPGIFVGRLDDGRPSGVREMPGCPLAYTDGTYRDCEGTLFGLDGEPRTPAPSRLPPVPVQVYRGELFFVP